MSDEASPLDLHCASAGGGSFDVSLPSCSIRARVTRVQPISDSFRVYKRRCEFYKEEIAMRRFVLVTALVILSLTTTHAFAQTLGAVLTGSQEVPATTTPGYGNAT